MVVVVFYPDAFSAMTGLDLSQFSGRPIVEEVLPRSIFEPCRNFLDDVPREGTEKSLSAFYDQIEIVWASMRPDGNRPARRLKDWSRSLALRAAFSGPGRSTRQIARRIKSWTGLRERPARTWPLGTALCQTARGHADGRSRLGRSCHSGRVCRPGPHDQANASIHRLHTGTASPKRWE